MTSRVEVAPAASHAAALLLLALLGFVVSFSGPGRLAIYLCTHGRLIRQLEGQLRSAHERSGAYPAESEVPTGDGRLEYRRSKGGYRLCVAMDFDFRFCRAPDGWYWRGEMID